MASMSSLLRPLYANGSRAPHATGSYSEVLQGALDDQKGAYPTEDPWSGAHQATRAASYDSNSTPAGFAAHPGADISPLSAASQAGPAPAVPTSILTAFDEDSLEPPCSIPGPLSEKPVIETEGFLPLLSGDEPQGPACSMPVPLSHQQDPLDLIVSLPPTEAGGYGGDWLSAIIDGPAAIAAYAPDCGADSRAEATFVLWYGLLGAGDGAGDALMVAKAGGEAGMEISAASDTLGASTQSFYSFLHRYT